MLVLSNYLAAARENVTLSRENLEREFQYTLTMRDDKGKNKSYDAILRHHGI